MGLINRKNDDANVDASVETTAAQVEAPAKEVAVRESAGTPSTINGFWLGNADVQELVSNAEYGDFPQIIATSGTFKDSNAGVVLGDEIFFKPIQARVKMVCSPGSNDDEAKEFFAAVPEGELSFDGRTIEQCLEDAKAAGYEKASIKKYVDLYALIESNPNGKTDYSGEFVSLQLAPMSLIAWNRFSKKMQMKLAFGQLELNEPVTITAVATPATTANKKEYTHFNFFSV